MAKVYAMHKIRFEIVKFYHNLLISWPELQTISVQMAYILNIWAERWLNCWWITKFQLLRGWIVVKIWLNSVRRQLF